ncbi:MAG: ABC transporter ATP-binding protein [Alphaproteobacteria bacterium]|nr:ABC transporter ATP-binding protein [Alphaproteobacteria bacterium]
MSLGLEVENLNMNFGGIVVARDINFDLKPGDRKALIGPNGAGKTTFANLLTGILTPSSGTIRLDGQDIGHLKESRRVKAGVAKTFQITTLFKRMSVRENIRLPVLERRGGSRNWIGRADANAEVEDEIEALLSQFKLQPSAEVQVQDLAYGQQRLVEMALTLALKPRILILDEPSAGVPSSDSHVVTDAIEGLPEDLSVLIIEHDMTLVFKVASTIVVLVDGAILTEGTPAEISKDQQVRDLYLGARHGR